MKWNKRPIVSEEAVKSREVAVELHAQALDTLSLAEQLGRKLAKIRSENHIAAAIDTRKAS